MVSNARRVVNSRLNTLNFLDPAQRKNIPITFNSIPTIVEAGITTLSSTEIRSYILLISILKPILITTELLDVSNRALKMD